MTFNTEALKGCGKKSSWVFNGTLSLRDLVEAAIKRIEAGEGRLNAETTRRFEPALTFADMMSHMALANVYGLPSNCLLVHIFLRQPDVMMYCLIWFIHRKRWCRWETGNRLLKFEG